MITVSIQFRPLLHQPAVSHFALPLMTNDFEEAEQFIIRYMEHHYPQHYYTAQMTRTDGVSRRVYTIQDDGSGMFNIHDGKGLSN